MARLKKTSKISPALKVANRSKDQLVAVTWADAHSLDSFDWKSVKDLNLDDSEYLITSVGFKLPDPISKKKHLVIYQSRTADGDLDHVLCVPAAMIRSIRVL